MVTRSSLGRPVDRQRKDSKKRRSATLKGRFIADSSSPDSGARLSVATRRQPDAQALQRQYAFENFDMQGWIKRWQARCGDGYGLFAVGRSVFERVQARRSEALGLEADKKRVLEAVQRLLGVVPNQKGANAEIGEQMLRAMALPPYWDAPVLGKMQHIVGWRLDLVVEAYVHANWPGGWRVEQKRDREDRINKVLAHLNVVVDELKQMEVDGYPMRSIRCCVDEQWLDDIAASPERLARYQASLPSTDLSWRDQLRRGATAITNLCFSGALPQSEEDVFYNMDGTPESSARALEMFGKELHTLLSKPRAVKHGGRANACIELFIDRLVEDLVSLDDRVDALPWCANRFVAEMVNRLWSNQEGDRKTAAEIARIRKRSLAKVNG